ncbi:MAG: hypothetical protein COX62_00070 [Deltaproteobacteria bacterium CG_4_10_14_0_2_um_filter_43_8]|nr:MAG: hypothetical protein COX62_00070 [Deltaproteobacteria bacterium CG_4_10_14_0_2_um_filter_43_8]PJC63898.1 MAG: hypothetical protein CO021_07080 [Deltaproteobacteria bacterium CG_4_9_14_0_2_um_filter_42_21]
MMKKNLLILFGTFFFALIVWTLERPDLLPKGDVSEALLIPRYDAAQVMRVEYEHLIYGIQLKRENEIWKVALLESSLKKNLNTSESTLAKTDEETDEVVWYNADDVTVKTALGIFGDLSQGIVVSTNPEKRAFYQVGAAAQKIRFYGRDDKLIISLFVGKNGPDYDSNYVRLDEVDEVRLVERSLQGIFSIELEDWKEKTDN